MAISLTPLFTKLGRLAGVLNEADAYHYTQLKSRTDTIASGYDHYDALIGDLYPSYEYAKSAGSPWASYLKSLAQSTLIEVVRQDNPRPTLGIDDAIAELIKQMEAAGACVAKMYPSVSSSAASWNYGNPSWVYSTYLPDGTTAVYTYGENLDAKVVADGQENGGATTGSERVLVRGQYTTVNPLSPDWPQGSGSQVYLTIVDPSLDSQGSYGNWLRNGDFSEWEMVSSTALYTPKYWEIEVGTAGTFVYESLSGYDDSAALTLYSNGVLQTTVTQEFNSSTGTPLALQPLDQFAVYMRLRAGSSGTTGTLRVALIDENGNPIDDEAGTENSFTCNLALLSTSTFSRVKGVFRTPKKLPASIRLEFRLTVPPASGKIVVIDEAAMARMVPLYQGGPSVSLFAGKTAAIRDDFWTLSVTTNANSRSWHRAFDRLFDGRSRGVVLPDCATPTIMSTLITYPPGGGNQYGESSGGGGPATPPVGPVSGLSPT